MRRLQLLMASVLFLACAACGSDSKTSYTTDQPMSTSVAIDAKKGGAVTAGSAALDIPGGSLSGNVKVTLKSSAPSSKLPDFKSVKGLVYEFGPEGTKFSPPATLKLPLPEAVGKDQEAVVSWLDTKANAWVDLKSTVKGSSVSAPVEHFTTFVIRFKGVAAGAVDCSFSACGGNIEGQWDVQGVCINKSNDGGVDGGGSSSPFGATCPTATVDIALDATGTAEFKSDKTFTFDLTSSGTTSITVPAECFDKLMIKTCDDLNKVFNSSSNKSDGGAKQQTVCTGDATKGCSCSGGDGKSNTSMTMGTYSTSGNTITTSKDGGMDDPSDYCVKGSELKVMSKDGTVITAKKK